MAGMSACLYTCVSLAILVHPAAGLVHKNAQDPEVSLSAAGEDTQEGSQEGQNDANANASPTSTAGKGLVLVHVPYNFGHTIEKIAAFGNGFQANIHFGISMISGSAKQGGFTKKSLSMRRHHLNATSFLENYGLTRAQLGRRSNHKVVYWGALATQMLTKSAKGCPMYLTPAKFWPKELQQQYFGDPSASERFGLIRDPLERLVAIFRGAVGGETGDVYGGKYDEWSATCDVDGAVHAMMDGYIKNRYTDPYSHGCTFLPQTDFIGPPEDYGISKPIDNRKFPMNINKLFKDYKLPYEIMNADILHVTGCESTWAGAVTPETRQLVNLVYKEDYDYLCKEWNYCEKDESTCLQHVPRMCPRNLSLAPEPIIEFPFGFAIYPPFQNKVRAKSVGMHHHNVGPTVGTAVRSWASRARSAFAQNAMANRYRMANSYRTMANSYAMSNNGAIPYAAAAPRNPWAAPSYPPMQPSYQPMPPSSAQTPQTPPSNQNPWPAPSYPPMQPSYQPVPPSSAQTPPSNQPVLTWYMNPMHTMMSKALRTRDPRAMHAFGNAFAVNPWAAVPWDDWQGPAATAVDADDDWQGAGGGEGPQEAPGAHVWGHHVMS